MQWQCGYRKGSLAVIQRLGMLGCGCIAFPYLRNAILYLLRTWKDCWRKISRGSVLASQFDKGKKKCMGSQHFAGRFILGDTSSPGDCFFPCNGDMDHPVYLSINPLVCVCIYSSADLLPNHINLSLIRTQSGSNVSSQYSTTEFGEMKQVYFFRSGRQGISSIRTSRNDAGTSHKKDLPRLS